MEVELPASATDYIWQMSPGSSCDENVQYLGVQTDDAALVEVSCWVKIP